MISFYPGPSQVAPEISHWMHAAVTSGILATNHRSEPFMNLYRETRETVFQALNVPDDYHLIFPSSATECWEIITQSYARMRHNHVFNGAFGEKWHTYAQRISPLHYAHPFPAENECIPKPIESDAAWFHFTHCETSNGTFTNIDPEWKALNPQAFIAVDATASLGGANLPLSDADIWFASVQKCLGLPSGMAIMLLSPRAAKKAYAIDERGHYNSLPFCLDNAAKWQTPYTPNILGIYLLNQVHKRRPPIETLNDQLIGRMRQLDQVVAAHPHLNHFIKNEKVRGHTVATIESSQEIVEKIKNEARKQGMVFGNGYGALKSTTFRIANFPAIPESAWNNMLEFLDKSANSSSE